MNKLTIALILVATNLVALDYYENGTFVETRATPKSVVVGGMRVFKPNTNQLVEAGYYSPVYSAVTNTQVATNWVRVGIVNGVSLYTPQTIGTNEYAIEQAAAAAAAEEARQLAKPLVLKQTENNFLLLCEAVLQSRDKADFETLQAALEALLLTDPNTSMVLSLRLLAIDGKAKREGGLKWWDDCVWHADIVE